MTRRDFIVIAMTLRSLRPEADNPETGWDSQLRTAGWLEWHGTCRAFVNALRATNPRFDPTRFLTMAGAYKDGVMWGPWHEDDRTADEAPFLSRDDRANLMSFGMMLARNDITAE